MIVHSLSAMSQSTNRAHVCRPAPEFKADATMPDGQFGSVSLSDFKGKYVVLFSYPLGKPV
jgi:alkyl hydroperoxide reductase subunit AhpC